MRTFLILAALAAALAATAGTAAASSPPPTLAFCTVSGCATGETFFTSNFTYTRDCDTAGTSTINFNASGTAFGPYPGTFTESGTVQVGPQTFPNVFSSFLADVGFGEVTTLTATFSIDSPSTGSTVTGTKSLILPSNENFDYGRCSSFSGEDVPTFNYTDGHGTATSFTAAVEYDASLHTPAGNYHDSGTANVNGSDIAGVATTPTGTQALFSIGGFSQTFAHSGGVTAEGAANVTLSPPSAVNDVGTSHTVAASAQDSGGGPVAGTTILFSVSGSTHASGSCTTDASGTCSFTYAGPDLPGADQITGCADVNSNGMVDPGEPCGTATKSWVLPVSTPGQTTGGGQVLSLSGANDVAFGFTAKDDQNGVKGECSVVDPEAGIKVKCVDVTALTQTATHATFFGDATINGSPTTYRIDVDDNSEPGAGSDTFKIHTANGYTAGGVLERGNIQVHQ